MAFALSGTAPNEIITQTGTDTNLSALAAVAGVTTRVVGNKTIYNIGNRRFRASGDLSYDARTEKIESIGCTTSPVFEITSGGNYAPRSFIAIGGINYPTYDEAFESRPLNNTVQTEFQLSQGGTLNLQGAKISVAGTGNNLFQAMIFHLGATLSITNGWLKSGLGVGQQSRWGEGGSGNLSAYNINGLVLENLQFTVFSVIGTALGVEPFNAFTQVVSATGLDLQNYTPKSPSNGADNWDIANLYLTDAFYGSLIPLTGGNGAVGINRFTTMRKRLVVQAVDLLGAAVTGAVSYIRDTNNGARQNVVNIPNQLNDNVYIQSTNGGGATPQQTVFVLHGKAVSGGFIQPMTRDYRSKTTVAGADLFDIHVWAYAQQYTLLPDQPFKGAGVTTYKGQMPPDTSVTLTQAAAGALTSINNLDQLHDAAKHWKTRPVQAQLEYPTIGTQPITPSGTELLSGIRAIVVDALASTAFSINTTTHTITIKSSNLAAGVKFKTLASTTTITAINGATISAPFTDVNNAGQITITGPTATDTVEMRKASDSSLIATRTGSGAFAVSPANVGVSVYFERKVGAVLVMSTQPTPVTLTAGANADVPMFAGSQVQVANLDNVAKETTLQALASTNQAEHDATQLAIAAMPAPLNSAQTQAAAAAALVAYDAVVPADLAGLATSANVAAAQSAIIAEVDAIPTNPLLTTDTRLNNLDAAISTRGTLTAPQVRTELATELGRLDVAVGTRLAASAYTAPANADITAVKAKTDSLTFTQSGAVDANIQYVNDVQVKGTGTESDPWNPQ
jgi:hypothetical protein